MNDVTPSNVKRGFGLRMQLLRRVLEFKTTVRFAEHIGVTADAMYKYEQGARCPHPADTVFQKIRERTGATAEWLLYNDLDSLPSSLRRDIIEYQRAQATDSEA